MPIDTEGSVLVAGATALVTLLGGTAMGLVRGYLRVKEATREDKTADALDEARLGVVDQLRKELARTTERTDLLTTRLDTMAAERNAAMIENATLREKVAALTKDVEELKLELEKVEREREALAKAVHGLNDTLGGFSSENDPENKGRRTTDKAKAQLKPLDDREWRVLE